MPCAGDPGRDPYLPVRGDASRDGTFRIEGIEPGTYLFRACQRGFRAYPIREITLHAGESLDLGEVVLEVTGCDEPGVYYDSIGPAEPPPLAVGTATLRLAEPYDFDSVPGSSRRGKADVELRRDGSSLVVVPLKGAALTDALWCRGCGRKILRTSGRHTTRVFLMGEVSSRSTEANIYFVTHPKLTSPNTTMTMWYLAFSVN